MNDNTRKSIIEKEIETYRKFATVFESLKAVVHSFDGKCFNKKFVEAMEEFLKYGKEEKSYHVNAGINTTPHGNFFDISIHTYDDYIKGEPDSNGYSVSYRIINSDCFLRMKTEETTTKTDGGKYRINARAVIEQFNEKIQYLNDKAASLKKGLNEVETMRADIEQIIKLMDKFDEKYHGRIKEVFGCDYCLKDNSEIPYRYIVRI